MAGHGAERCTCLQGYELQPLALLACAHHRHSVPQDSDEHVMVITVRAVVIVQAVAHDHASPLPLPVAASPLRPASSSWWMASWACSWRTPRMTCLCSPTRCAMGRAWATWTCWMVSGGRAGLLAGVMALCVLNGLGVVTGLLGFRAPAGVQLLVAQAMLPPDTC